MRNEPLKDKKLGYGKLLKDMKAEDFNFFSGEALNIATGIVYKEEDIKSAVKWLKDLIRNTSYNELKLSIAHQEEIKHELIGFINEAFPDIIG